MACLPLRLDRGEGWGEVSNPRSGCAAAENELGNKIRRPPRGFTQRHAKTEKIFGVHVPIQNLYLKLRAALIDFATQAVRRKPPLQKKNHC